MAKRVREEEREENVKCQRNKFSEIILDYVGGVNAVVGDNGDTLLHKAVRDKNTRMVGKLLERSDIDVNILNARGVCALYIALCHYHEEICELLLAQENINVNVMTNVFEDCDDDYESILYCALRQQRFYIVDMLLKRNDIDVNGNNAHENGEYGYVESVIQLAVRHDYFDIVKQLLTFNDIELNSVESDHCNTALLNAYDYGNEEIFDLLFAHPNVDINIENDFPGCGAGCTLLQRVAEKGDMSTLEKLLCRNDIDLNKETNEYGTALCVAVSFAYGNVVERLLLQCQGIDIYKGDPFIDAVGAGNSRIVHLFLSVKHFDVNRHYSKRNTALHYAAFAGHHIVIEKILAVTYVDVNKVNDDDMTPLMEAAKNGHEKCVQELLTHSSIDVNLQRKIGQTALTMADGHCAIIDLLMAAGARPLCNKSSQ